MEYKDIANLFTKPEKFYKSVKKVNSKFDIMMTYFVFLLISTIMSTVINLFFSDQWSILNPVLVIILALILTIMVAALGTVINSYFESALNYLMLKILGVESTFFSAFKPTVYARIIGAVYAIIILPVTILLNVELAELEQNALALMGADFATTGVLILFILFLSLVAFVHETWAKAVGISYYNKCSMAKAVGAILLGVLFAAILAFVIILVIAAIAAAILI